MPLFKSIHWNGTPTAGNTQVYSFVTAEFAVGGYPKINSMTAGGFTKTFAPVLVPEAGETQQNFIDRIAAEMQTFINDSLGAGTLAAPPVASLLVNGVDTEVQYDLIELEGISLTSTSRINTLYDKGAAELAEEDEINELRTVPTQEANDIEECLNSGHLLNCPQNYINDLERQRISES